MSSSAAPQHNISNKAPQLTLVPKPESKTELKENEKTQTQLRAREKSQQHDEESQGEVMKEQNTKESENSSAEARNEEKKMMKTDGKSKTQESSASDEEKKQKDEKAETKTRNNENKASDAVQLKLAQQHQQQSVMNRDRAEMIEQIGNKTPKKNGFKFTPTRLAQSIISTCRLNYHSSASIFSSSSTSCLISSSNSSFSMQLPASSMAAAVSTSTPVAHSKVSISTAVPATVQTACISSVARALSYSPMPAGSISISISKPSDQPASSLHQPVCRAADPAIHSAAQSLMPHFVRHPSLASSAAQTQGVGSADGRKL
jgi:hypothetical protein